MNPNQSRLTPVQVLAACDLITTQVQKVNPFNYDEVFLTSVASAHGVLASAAQAQVVAEANLRTKVAAKDDALRAARGVLSEAVKTALASGATDVQLRQIGMARPAKPVRPTAIPAPVDLVATALGDSRTKLVFGRGGAAYGATYQVFQSADGVGYEMVGTTTRTSLILEGQPAGQAAWYKVRAARSGLLSPFSNEATLYAPGLPARVQLKVA